MKQFWVGIDGNEANVANRVGSNVYAFEVLWALYEKMDQKSPFFVRVYLSGEVLADLPPATEYWQYRVIGPAKLWTQWRLPLDLFFGPPLQLFFSPGHYTPRVSPVPVIPSIMDLAFVFFPDQFKKKDAWQLTNLTRDSVQKAKHIVAISEYTKTDITKVYDYPSEKITVVYPAVRPVKVMKNEEVKAHLESFQITAPYIAFVGTLQPRKNIVRLIEAFEVCAAVNDKLTLVLAGKIGWLGDAIQEKISSSQYFDRIIQTGFVSNEQKQAIIQGAQATLLIGLYEGFGIPPLESIQLGTPPIVSTTSSLPEVVGQGGVLVDPYDVSSIASGIQDVLSWSATERKKKIEVMQKHAERFSWEASGQKLFDLFVKLLSSKL
jgi:glycosyltransferase involved in cell wall biosynthesis